MKKYYETPEAEIELFTVCDIMTDSGGIETGGDTVTGLADEF